MKTQSRKFLTANLLALEKHVDTRLKTCDENITILRERLTQGRSGTNFRSALLAAAAWEATRQPLTSIRDRMDLWKSGEIGKDEREFEEWLTSHLIDEITNNTKGSRQSTNAWEDVADAEANAINAKMLNILRRGTQKL